jgi:hypothetical protein
MISNAEDCEAAYYELGLDFEGVTWGGEISNPNTVPGCAWVGGGTIVKYNSNLQAVNNAETNNQGSICRVDGSTDNSDDEPQEPTDSNSVYGESELTENDLTPSEES